MVERWVRAHARAVFRKVFRKSTAATRRAFAQLVRQARKSFVGAEFTAGQRTLPWNSARAILDQVVGPDTVK